MKVKMTYKGIDIKELPPEELNKIKERATNELKEMTLNRVISMINEGKSEKEIKKYLGWI